MRLHEKIDHDIKDAIKAKDIEVEKLRVLREAERQRQLEVKEAERIIAKWNDKIESRNLHELPKQVINALLDDLNTPLSIHEMHQLFNKGNYQDLGNVCAFFGFVTKGLKVVSKITPELSEKVDKLVEKRNNARMAKNFSLADKIREDLLSAGITIKDSGQETTWETSQNLEIEKLK